MDYNINFEEENDAYSPHTKPMSYNSNQYQNVPPIFIEGELVNNNQPLQEEITPKYEHQEPVQAPTGVTKFCKLEYYEQYFKASQLDVTERIKLSFIPTQSTFIDALGNNPDFYGPFWILTTLIFLLSSTGNLSRYFYNWSKDEYIFKLELVRYGVMIVYSFGFGFPIVLHFVMKFFGGNKLSLPEMICLYGYSFSCFIPIFILCVLPFQALQWLLIAYGTLNTSAFLILNLKQHLQELETPKTYVIFGLIAGVQIALFLTFKLVFFKLVYESTP